MNFMRRSASGSKASSAWRWGSFRSYRSPARRCSICSRALLFKHRNHCFRDYPAFLRRAAERIKDDCYHVVICTVK